MFKRDGVYFMLTSGNSGRQPNQQECATATSITGRWAAMADAGDDTGYGSQTTFVLPVQGAQGTSYLYVGDSWGNSMGGMVNDSQYNWLPLTFPVKTTMNLPWYPQVAVDTVAGTVTGVGGGPYCNLVARHNQQWRFEDQGGLLPPGGPAQLQVPARQGRLHCQRRSSDPVALRCRHQPAVPTPDGLTRAGACRRHRTGPGSLSSAVGDGPAIGGPPRRWTTVTFEYPPGPYQFTS